MRMKHVLFIIAMLICGFLFGSVGIGSWKNFLSKKNKQKYCNYKRFM